MINARNIFVKIIFTAIAFSPATSFAQGVCLSKGYTIVTVNGINTTELEASKNSNELKYNFFLYAKEKDEPVEFKYIYNPTHSVLVDAADVLAQKVFETPDMSDGDFLKILDSASQNITTQKVLFVGHSQGNLYVNSLYDTVVNRGDLPPKSVGVYGVASPASRVAGNGKYLTSSTDKVIATYAKNGLVRSVLPPNIDISYSESDDDGRGHSFRDVYLKYKPKEIAQGVEGALSRLSVDKNRPENTLCIQSAPRLNALGSGVARVVYASTVISGGTLSVVKVGAYTASALAVYGYDSMIAFGNVIISTTVAVTNTLTSTAVVVSSLTHDALTGLFAGGPSIADSNAAAAIFATMPSLQTVPTPVAAPLSSESVNNNPTPSNTITQKTVSVPVFVEVPSQEVTSLAEGEQSSMPKLVFVGAQNVPMVFGGGFAPEVLAVTDEAKSVTEETTEGTPESLIATSTLPTPLLAIAQCTASLATDGCLLATTTVHLEWSTIAQADYYEIDNNGTKATTTSTYADIFVRDFSSHTLAITAFDSNGNKSASSTQTFFTATIPVAINEIAWMGTNASSNDEWFEIKNNSPYTIDLAQWELNAKDGTPHVKLAGTIAPRGYLLFERTDETTVSDVVAHQIYTGALGNAGEQLNLSYASTTLDQTPEITNGTWVAGENGTTTKKTMERYSSRESGADSANWGTNLGYVKNGTDANGNEIDGTPGAQNSISTLINKGQDITSDFTLTADEEKYVVAGQIFVEASNTLTIEPGVTISFVEQSEVPPSLVVFGSLDARGTAENPINFSSSTSIDDTFSDLYFIRTTGENMLDHTYFKDSNGINAFFSNVEIRDSEFSGLRGSGLSFRNSDSVAIENTNISSSTNTTIWAHNSDIVFASSTIKNQLYGDAINVRNSKLEISSSTIENVNDGSGIIGEIGSTVSIASSTIRNTKYDTVSLFGVNESKVSDSRIEGGEFNAGASGVFVDGYEGPTTVEIKDSVIAGFSDGVGVSASWVGASPDVASSSPIVNIINTEIGGNGVGIKMEEGTVSIAPDVSLHDNGSSSSDNIVVVDSVEGALRSND